MTDSAKRRHVQRYQAAMDKFEQIDAEATDHIDDYVEWLQSQITAKRKQNAALRAQVDEMGGGFDPHQFRNRSA